MNSMCPFGLCTFWTTPTVSFAFKHAHAPQEQFLFSYLKTAYLIPSSNNSQSSKIDVFSSRGALNNLCLNKVRISFNACFHFLPNRFHKTHMSDHSQHIHVLCPLPYQDICDCLMASQQHSLLIQEPYYYMKCGYILQVT